MVWKLRKSHCSMLLFTFTSRSLNIGTQHQQTKPTTIQKLPGQYTRRNNRKPTLACARLGEKNVLSRLFIDLFVYSIDIFLFPFIYKLVVESSFIKTFLVRERLNIKKDTSKVWSGICKPSVMLSMVNKYQQSPWLCLPKVYAPPPGKWNKTIQYYAFHREILQSVIMIKLCKYRIDL